MSEPNTEPAEALPEAPPAEALLDVQGKAGREAARYRTQLREAEAQRDTIRAQLVALQTQVIETSLPPNLKPEAWRLAHPDVSDLLSEDGTINRDALTEAISIAVETLGVQNPGPIIPTQGMQPKEPTSRKNPFAGAFAPKHG